MTGLGNVRCEWCGGQSNGALLCRSCEQRRVWELGERPRPKSPGSIFEDPNTDMARAPREWGAANPDRWCSCGHLSGQHEDNGQGICRVRECLCHGFEGVSRV